MEIMLSAHPELYHTFLECVEECLAQLLDNAVDARDLPGMADVDASLLYFCRLVKEHNKVALTGECADEIFGGYSWFYRSELTEGEEKVLLWNAFGGLLPQALLHRKKSPYPKTYSPCLRQALSFWHTWYR